MYRTAEGTFDRIDEYFMHHCNVETEVEEKTAGNAEVETSQSNEAKENETKNESLNETKENETNVPSNPSNSLSNPSNSLSNPSNPSPISSNSPSNSSNVPSNSSPYPRLLSYICIDQGKLCTLKYCSNCRIFVPPRVPGCRIASGFAITNSFYGFS